MSLTVELASGRVVSLSGYLGAVRAINLCSPRAREVLKAELQRTIQCRISRNLPWYRHGRKWV